MATKSYILFGEYIGCQTLSVVAAKWRRIRNSESCMSNVRWSPWPCKSRLLWIEFYGHVTLFLHAIYGLHGWEWVDLVMANLSHGPKLNFKIMCWPILTSILPMLTLRRHLGQHKLNNQNGVYALVIFEKKTLITYYIRIKKTWFSWPSLVTNGW